MDVTQETVNDLTVFKVAGRLDSNTSPDFESEVFAAIGDGTSKIVVDFSSLDYISSAGMRVILKAAKDLKGKGGGIVLSCMKDYVKEVFEIAGFDAFIPITATVDDARAKL